MSRIREHNDVQEFQLLTERLRHGRHGFRNDSIPEIAAWLCVHAMGYKRLLGTCSAPSQRVTDEWIIGMKRHCKDAIKVLQSLMNSIAKGWNRWEWNEATGYIADQLGIKIDTPVPLVGDTIDKLELYTGLDEPCPLAQAAVIDPSLTAKSNL